MTADLPLLVERARDGDSSAFAELTRRHFRAVFATTLAVLGNAADAEDVAQEAMLVAFERLNSCREPARFSGWLRQIARNLALNHLTARKRRRDDSSQEIPSREPPSPVAGTRQRLLAALAKLSEREREVVLLHDLHGWTHPELAEALGISEVMSRQLLFVARKQMRGALSDFAVEESP
ncbi:MAG: RNA polymerase sigma factor [Myxococcota bacterium]|nr:sigma-70 family RNA polymerase sigma factor [Myxococcota bacterium]